MTPYSLTDFEWFQDDDEDDDTDIDTDDDESCDDSETDDVIDGCNVIDGSDVTDGKIEKIYVEPQDKIEETESSDEEKDDVK